MARICASIPALRLVAAFVVASALLFPVQAIQAAGGPTAQQKLQTILAERHAWHLKLKAEMKHEESVQGRLSISEQKLTAQETRLLRAKESAAARRAQFVSAIEADQVRITNVGAAIVAARDKYQEVHARAEGLLLKLKRLEAEKHRQQRNVRAALVQIYEISQVNPLETALEAKSLTDLLKQQSYVNEIGGSDYTILERAIRERRATYRIAKVWIEQMRALRKLQRQERHELALIRADTRHENKLMAKAQAAAAREQQGIADQEAQVQALTNQEQDQLASVTNTAQNDSQMIQSDQQAAEQVAVVVEQESGAIPAGVWSGTTPLAEQAAETAHAYLGQVKTNMTPTGFWSGYCEGFAQFVYGEAFQAYDAIGEYHAMKAAGYIHPGIPLRGALVFYGGGGGLGHVAISQGNGQVVSTMGYSGQRLPIAENPYLAFPYYLGWAMPF